MLSVVISYYLNISFTFFAENKITYDILSEIDDETLIELIVTIGDRLLFRKNAESILNNYLIL